MKRILIALITVCLLAACGGEKQKADASRAKTLSAPYDLLVVANKEWMKTPTGTLLAKTVESPIVGLPSPEPCFKMTNVGTNDFSGTFQYYANVIVAEVSPKYRKAEVRVKEDLHAHPQLVYYITAPDNDSFEQLLLRYGADIIAAFNQKELNRERQLLEGKYSARIMQQARKQFGIEIKAPHEIDAIKVGKDFFWSSTNANPYRMNICIYTLPLRASSLRESFIQQRDSIMQINIPGGRDDQWMQTAAQSVMEEQTAMDRKTVPVMRGLWEMRNDAMGGPFVAYLHIDSTSRQILVTEAFMFAPEVKKRPYYRKLEAALMTVRR